MGNISYAKQVANIQQTLQTEVELSASKFLPNCTRHSLMFQLADKISSVLKKMPFDKVELIGHLDKKCVDDLELRIKENDRQIDRQSREPDNQNAISFQKEKQELVEHTEGRISIALAISVFLLSV